MGVAVQAHVFLTSVVIGGEMSASRPDRFTPRNKSPVYPVYMRLSGPQNRSGRRGEEKKSCPYRDSNPSAVQPIASRYTDSPLPLYYYTGY
jgi:hypothetical protein